MIAVAMVWLVSAAFFLELVHHAPVIEWMD
jgi:hypothetical protein